MASMTTRQYRIDGFHCNGCADNLGRALARLEGVIKAEADYDQAIVQVRFDPDWVTDHDIHTQIRTAGFEPLSTEPQE